MQAYWFNLIAVFSGRLCLPVVNEMGHLVAIKYKINAIFACT